MPIYPDCSLRRYRERYSIADAVSDFTRQGIGRPAALSAVANMFDVPYVAVFLAPDRY